MQISGSIRCCLTRAVTEFVLSLKPGGRSPAHSGRTRRISRHVQFHVFEVTRLVVDADFRRSDPTRELARLPDGLHERANEIAVFGIRQPFAATSRPFLVRED